VLLTRARQGMVIFVPPGAKRDKKSKALLLAGTRRHITGTACERNRCFV
jgi:hypothetical protein